MLQLTRHLGSNSETVVELKLGYGEQDREAQKMMQLHQMFSQDNIATNVLAAEPIPTNEEDVEAQGILNVEDYLHH